jgi:Hypothetical protein (DUF2513)
MNRDMDLIRALMLKLEALPVDGHSIFAIGPADEELAVDGASFDQIDYHLGLLRKQGFLDCPGEPMLLGKFPFRGLSQQIVSRLGCLRRRCLSEALENGASIRPRRVLRLP